MAKKKFSKKKKVRKKHFIAKPKQKNSQTIAIIALILNIIILPGLGTLIGGKIKEGIWQLVLLIGGLIIGILLVSVGYLLGTLFIILGPLSAWIWGIVSGVQLIRESSN